MSGALYPILPDQVEEFAQLYRAGQFKDAERIFDDFLQEAQPIPKSVKRLFEEEAWGIFLSYTFGDDPSGPRSPLQAADRISVLTRSYRADAGRFLYGAEELPAADIYLSERHPSEFEGGIPAPDILVFGDNSGIVQDTAGPRILLNASSWILDHQPKTVTIVYDSGYHAGKLEAIPRGLKTSGIRLVQLIV